MSTGRWLTLHAPFVAIRTKRSRFLLTLEKIIIVRTLSELSMVMSLHETFRPFVAFLDVIAFGSWIIPVVRRVSQVLKKFTAESSVNAPLLLRTKVLTDIVIDVLRFWGC